MGSITFQVVGDASVGTLTKTFTIADADINRFVAMAKSWYGGNGSTTTAQACLNWANDIMDVTRQRVIQTEKNAAAAAAGPTFTAT